MSGPYAAELESALRAVRAAATICRAVQNEISADAMEKKDRSPVTIADYASQAAVCRILKEAFPDDVIVAEEDSQDLQAESNENALQKVLEHLRRVDMSGSATEICQWIDCGNHDASASRFWTLDPIDGTKGFLRKEQYAISLALIVDGTIQVAALACPNLAAQDAWDNARGVVFSAVAGRGARLAPLDLPEVTPHTVRVAGTGKAAMARLCESVESGHSDHDQSAQVRQLLGITEEAVRLDSQAKYGVVARGEADIYLRLPTRAGYEEKIWDHAGGVLIVEEAGGKVTDIDGKPLDFSQGCTLKANRGVMVTNGVLHQQVLDAIQQVGV